MLTFTRFGGYSDTVVVDASWAYSARRCIHGGGRCLAGELRHRLDHADPALARCNPGDCTGSPAGGGVGIAALQICQWRGATAIGTASVGKHARLRNWAMRIALTTAARILNRKLNVTLRKGRDVVLDPQVAIPSAKVTAAWRPGSPVHVRHGRQRAGRKPNIPALLRSLAPHPCSIPCPCSTITAACSAPIWDACSTSLTGSPPTWSRSAAAGEGVLAPVVDQVFPSSRPRPPTITCRTAGTSARCCCGPGRVPMSKPAAVGRRPSVVPGNVRGDAPVARRHCALSQLRCRPQ